MAGHEERLGTGREYLTGVQYPDGSNLAARQSIYAYRETPFDLQAWVIDAAGLDGSETVLDVGCGNGAYLAELARRGHRGLVVGMDLSRGMATEARQSSPAAAIVVGDVQRLPFADSRADVVLAMHMLYHAPRIDLAAAELRRALRPNGIALAVTNGDDHLAEMAALFQDAAEAVTGTRPDPFGRSFRAFHLDNGAAYLEAAFDQVVRHDRRGVLRISDAAPIAAYAASMGAFIVGDGAPNADAVLPEIERRAAEVIARDGALAVHVHTGCFTCR